MKDKRVGPFFPIVEVVMSMVGGFSLDDYTKTLTVSPAHVPFHESMQPFSNFGRSGSGFVPGCVLLTEKCCSLKMGPCICCVFIVCVYCVYLLCVVCCG
jgi:hypothetical protein